MATANISVIIPAYNAERFLAHSLRSCVEQTLSPMEIIVVDDGSTDGTLALAQEWAQKYPYIQVIHTENGGVCSARNEGLRAAKGDWITFLDADDEFFLNALETLTGYIDTDKDVGIVIGCIKGVEETEREKYSRYPVEKTEVQCWKGTMALEKSLEDNPATYGVVGRLFRKDIVQDVRFTVGKRMHEDTYYLFTCLLKEPTVVVSNEFTYKCVLTANSTSRGGFSDKYFDILYFAEQKREEILERYPQFEAKAKNVWLKANLVLLYALYLQKDKRYKARKKACIREIRRYKQYFLPVGNYIDKFFKAVKLRVQGPYMLLVRVKARRKNRGKTR